MNVNMRSSVGLVFLSLCVCVFSLTGCKTTQAQRETPAQANAPVENMADCSEMERAGLVTHFATNSTVVSDKVHGELAKLAQCLKQNDDWKVKIVGYTDARGSDAYNLALGERRAMAVAYALKGHAVAEGCVAVYSEGKKNPVMNANNAAAWAKNRRVTLEIYSE